MSSSAAASGWSVMDRSWEAVQKKTFTRWCNKFLKRKSIKIEDLVTDLQDGVNLIELVQILGEEPLPQRFNRKPKMRVHRIENVTMALSYMAAHGVKTVAIGGEDIVDGNNKLILGMIWTIIIKWAIEEISVEELNARDALLLWCQRMTKGYKDVNIANFGSSWNDGLAFCALVHHFRSQMFNYGDLDKVNAEDNTRLAFNCFEQLDIPVFLDVEDIAGNPKPDEKSVMTQVAELYHYFASEMKGETAAKRISKLLALTRENDALKSDYARRTTILLQWVEEAQQYLTTRDFDNTRDGIIQRSDEFKGWKRDVLPGQVTEKLELDGLFNSLQTKLRLNNRQPYVPPEGLSPSDVDAVWRVLDENILSLGKDIGVELRRQDRLYQLRDTFDARQAYLQSWCDAKQEFLASSTSEGSVEEMKALVTNHGWLEDEIDDQKAAFTKLSGLGSQIIELNYIDADIIQTMLTGMDETFALISAAAGQRRVALETELDRQTKIDTLKTQLARKATGYARWLAQAISSANEAVYVRSDDGEIKETERYEAFVIDMQENADRMGIINGLIGQLTELNVTDPLSYSETTLESIEELCGQLEAAAASYKQRLDDAIAQYRAEVASKKQIEDYKTQLARKVQRYYQWLAQAISAAGESVFVKSAEDQENELARFEEFVAEKDEHADRMGIINGLIGQLTELNVTDPLSYSETTLESIEELCGQLEAAAASYKQRLDDAIAQYRADQDKIAAFEESVKEFHTAIEYENDILASLKGELEEQKAVVEERVPIINGYSGKLEPLGNMYAELEDLNISHFTEWTIAAITAEYTHLDQFVHKQLGVIEGQILEKSGSKVTAEQLEMFQHNFNAFDRDKSNGLNPNELKSLLTSIGEERDDEFCLKVLAEYSHSPGKEGREITLDEFIEFITKLLEDADSPTAIQEAFALCADGKPYVTEGDLRKLFDGDDVAYMLDNMVKSEQGDGYDYMSFTADLFAR